MRNWSTYNTALVARGSLTLWIPDDIATWWYGDGHNTYSYRAIETVVSLYTLHGMSLRATQGCAQSIFALMSISLSVPDYSTISRRADTLETTLRKMSKKVRILFSTQHRRKSSVKESRKCTNMDIPNDGRGQRFILPLAQTEKSVPWK